MNEKSKKQSPKSTLERVRAFHNRATDIGVIPNPKNPRLVESCRLNLEKFLTAFGKHVFFRAFSADQLAVISGLQDAILRHGRKARALPRGAGKTSIGKWAILWALLYGHRKFAVVVGPSKEHGVEVMADIMRELTENDALTENFPGACFPLVKLEGRAQRTASQHCNGTPTEVTWTKKKLVLPTTAGRAAGACLVARGITGSIRGLVRGAHRPDFVLLDDPQDRKSAESQTQTDDRERIILGDIMGLAGHDRQISAYMTCTVIARGDLADRMLDRKLHPDWSGERGRLVYRWPESSLWEEYEQIWRVEQAGGDGEARAARDFYQRHRVEMDAGAEVADPGLYDAVTEISAIQHAYNLRLSLGEKSFAAEYQNDPQTAESTTYELSADIVAARVGAHQRMQPAGDELFVVAFADINYSALHWTIAGFSPGFRARVLAYGRTPSVGVLVQPNASETERRQRIAAGLTEWEAGLLSTGLKIRAAGVDGGFDPELVRAWLNARKSGMFFMSRGFASNRYRPERALQLFDHAHVTETKIAGRHVAYNADYWRETMQRAFLCDAAAPGSCVLHAGSRSDHYEYAQHLTAERLAEKAYGDGGTTFYRWIHAPGTHWDWGDSLTGCYVAAAVLGATMNHQPKIRPKETRKPKVEMQR